MVAATPGPRRPQVRSLQQASLLEAPSLLMRKVRGLSSNRTLTWLACVPIALMGLGLFNLAAHAAELPELNAGFLANNMFLFVCAVLVIFMNAGFAMVEAGMCRQKKCGQHPCQEPDRVCPCGDRLLVHWLQDHVQR